MCVDKKLGYHPNKPEVRLAARPNKKPIQKLLAIQKLRFRNYCPRFGNYDSETAIPGLETTIPDLETTLQKLEFPTQNYNSETTVRDSEAVIQTLKSPIQKLDSEGTAPFPPGSETIFRELFSGTGSVGAVAILACIAMSSH